jgi:hypothetical protein
VTVLNPRQLNLVDIEIAQLKKSATVRDPDFDEYAGPRRYGMSGAGAACSPPIVIQGQVNLGGRMFEVLKPEPGGDRAPLRGHLVFEMEMLDQRGVTLQKGDRITKIAGYPIDARVEQLRPQCPLLGRFLLLFVDFTENVHKRGAT